MSLPRFVDPNEIPSNAVILDARPLNAFLEAHIAGARWVDFVSAKFSIRSAADLEAFHAVLERVFGAVGVTLAQPVVVYDNGPENRAARTAWALEYAGCEVGILQGGFPAWQGFGGALEAGEVAPAPTDFRVRPRPELLATVDEIKAGLERGDLLVVDARNQAEYEGSQWPPGGSKGGRIPGAKHFDWVRVVDATGFKQGAELEAALQSIPTDRELIVHCQSGARSAALYQALKSRGVRVKNYIGSMNEWFAQPDCAVAEGPGEEL